MCGVQRIVWTHKDPPDLGQTDRRTLHTTQKAGEAGN